MKERRKALQSLGMKDPIYVHKVRPLCKSSSREVSYVLVSKFGVVIIYIGGYQFDFLNWFYWSLWWQQYWASLQVSQFCGPPGGGFPSVNPWAVPPSSSTNAEQQNRDVLDAASRPDHVTDYQQQWMQYYNQMNANTNQQPQQHMPPFPQQPFAGGGNAYQRGVGVMGQQEARPGLTLRIRMISGGPATEQLMEQVA